MMSKTPLIAAFLLLLLPIAPARAMDTPAGWSTDLEAARAQADDTGKLLLILCGSDKGPPWPWAAEVLRDKAVKAQLDKFVTVFVDSDSDPRIARQYRLDMGCGCVIVPQDPRLIQVIASAPTAPPVFAEYLEEIHHFLTHHQRLSEAIQTRPDDHAPYLERADLYLIRSLRYGHHSIGQAVLDYQSALERADAETSNQIKTSLHFAQNAMLFRSVLQGTDHDLQRVQDRMQSFVVEHPGHRHASTAAFFVAYATYTREGQDAGKVAFKRVVQQHANTLGAELAQDELNGIEMIEFYSRQQPPE